MELLLKQLLRTRGQYAFFCLWRWLKKILFILNKMVDATDSILLIDEIETGLHKKYFDTLFPIVFALADKLNVQLFIATHSIEAIDAILR